MDDDALLARRVREMPPGWTLLHLPDGTWQVERTDGSAGRPHPDPLTALHDAFTDWVVRESD